MIRGTWEETVPSSWTLWSLHEMSGVVAAILGSQKALAWGLNLPTEDGKLVPGGGWVTELMLEPSSGDLGEQDSKFSFYFKQVVPKLYCPLEYMGNFKTHPTSIKSEPLSVQSKNQYFLSFPRCFNGQPSLRTLATPSVVEGPSTLALSESLSGTKNLRPHPTLWDLFSEPVFSQVIYDLYTQ